VILMCDIRIPYCTWCSFDSYRSIYDHSWSETYFLVADAKPISWQQSDIMTKTISQRASFDQRCLVINSRCIVRDASIIGDVITSCTRQSLKPQTATVGGAVLFPYIQHARLVSTLTTVARHRSRPIDPDVGPAAVSQYLWKMDEWAINLA